MVKAQTQNSVGPESEFQLCYMVISLGKSYKLSALSSFLVKKKKNNNALDLSNYYYFIIIFISIICTSKLYQLKSKLLKYAVLFQILSLGAFCFIFLKDLQILLAAWQIFINFEDLF